MLFRPGERHRPGRGRAADLWPRSCRIGGYFGGTGCLAALRHQARMPVSRSRLRRPLSWPRLTAPEIQPTEGARTTAFGSKPQGCRDRPSAPTAGRRLAAHYRRPGLWLATGGLGSGVELQWVAESKMKAANKSWSGNRTTRRLMAPPTTGTWSAVSVKMYNEWEDKDGPHYLALSPTSTRKRRDGSPAGIWKISSRLRNVRRKQKHAPIPAVGENRRSPFRGADPWRQ